MSLFSNKIMQHNPQTFNRIYSGGFLKMGNIKREADSRTIDQIKETVDAYAQITPEIKNFVEEIKKLPKKHMGLISDTLELANHSEMTMTNINLKNINGNNITPKIIEDMIYASKENPEAMNLVEAIINNTDTTASKVALYQMSGGILRNKQLAPQMKETAKIVPDIAKETLTEGYLGTFEKENNFMNFIKTFVNPTTVPNKITSVFRDLSKFADETQGGFRIDINEYITSKAPIEKIKANLQTLKELSKIKYLDNFDLTKFVLKNENLK